MGTPDDALRWGLVVPVKPLALAKTRLSSYGDDVRSALALAFAADTVEAALACPLVVQVVVVSDDPQVAADLTGRGVCVVPDGPDAGHNAALRHGAGLLGQRRPELGVASLSSDLPSLRPDELGHALAAVRTRAFAADAAGTGTTLLAAAPGYELAPEYGAGSRERHLASGARQLAVGQSLARDVDTPQDLAEALRLGVGPRTGAVVARLG